MLEKITLKHVKSIEVALIGGSQAPLITDLGQVWCTSRDNQNRSFPVLLGRLKSDISFALSYDCSGYSFLGKKGSKNSQGNMLSQVLGDELIITGWTLGADKESTSRNCTFKTTLKDLSRHKIIMYEDNDGVSTSMAFFDDKDNLYYMSYQGWLNGEAIYSIKSCKVTEEGYTNFQTILKGQHCYARPVAYGDELWYSYRDFGKRNYRAGCSKLIDGVWFPLEISTDEEIIAYPYPFCIDNTKYILYNNDRSLRGKIQIAEVIYE